MNALIQKLINFYNSNAKFHSFVVAVEFAFVSAATSWTGGVPTTKSAWVAATGFFGGLIWGAIKRWMASNVATLSVPMAGQQLTTNESGVTSTQSSNTKAPEAKP